METLSPSSQGDGRPSGARGTTGAKPGDKGDAAPFAPPSPHMRSDKGNTCGGAGNQTGPREDSARNQVALQPPLPLLDYDLRPTWRRSGKGPVWRRMFPCRCMAGSAACRNFALPYCGFLCRESNHHSPREPAALCRCGCPGCIVPRPPPPPGNRSARRPHKRHGDGREQVRIPPGTNDPGQLAQDWHPMGPLPPRLAPQAQWAILAHPKHQTSEFWLTPSVPEQRPLLPRVSIPPSLLLVCLSVSIENPLIDPPPITQ